MSLRRFVLVPLALALVAAPTAAQTPSSDSTLVDKVVAVVGDSVVLLSQIEEQVAQLKLQGEPVPTDPAQLDTLEHQILNDLVDNLLVLRAASKDTIVMNEITNARVQQATDQLIQNRTAAIGGPEAMQQALRKEGMTLAEFRTYIASMIRQRQITGAYLQQQLQNAPPVEVTDADLHAAFQQESAQLGQRPKQVSLSQVVIAPEASDTAQARAKALAESLLKRIRNGEKFSELAKRYSEDPGSAPLGGYLGWVKRGRTVKAFEDAAFSLLPGQVSNVVKTRFGYHIIKVEHRRPGEVEARHILIIPKIHEADVERARSLAMEVLAKARADSSMQKLYDEYGDPLTPDSMTVPFTQIDSLPPAYGALRTAEQGEVVGPLEYNASGRGSPSPTDTRFAIVKVTKIREAGAYTFDEMKSQLAQTLQQQKQTEQIIADLRRKTYIKILM